MLVMKDFGKSIFHFWRSSQRFVLPPIFEWPVSVCMVSRDGCVLVAIVSVMPSITFFVFAVNLKSLLRHHLFPFA